MVRRMQQDGLLTDIGSEALLVGPPLWGPPTRHPCQE